MGQGPEPMVAHTFLLGERVEGKRDVRDAHVMAMRMMMTIMMAPALPRMATDAAGGTSPPPASAAVRGRSRVRAVNPRLVE